MRSVNVEFVQSIVAAWESGDFGSMDWAHAEIEFVLDDGISCFSSTGMAAMVERWSDFLGGWDDYRTGADEYRELDAERVLVLSHHSGRGKRSGLEVAQFNEEGAGVFHIRDGKVFRLVTYFDRERAFADLGFESDTSSPGP
jgi:hypothetical protein